MERGILRGFRLELEKIAKSRKEKRESRDKHDPYPYGLTPPAAAMKPGPGALVNPVIPGGDEVHSGI